jgi:hypothetical protein
MRRQFLQFTGPQTLEIGLEELPALPADQVLIQAQFSAISPGTELLIYQGQAPTSLEADSSLSTLAGDLTCGRSKLPVTLWVFARREGRGNRRRGRSGLERP